MIRQKIYHISKRLTQLIHPQNQQKTSISIEIFVLAILKAQELAIAIGQNTIRNQEMKLIANFAKLTLIAEQSSLYYFTITISIFFAIHLAFNLLLTLNFYKQMSFNYLLSNQLLNCYLTYYTSILYTPVLYSSLKIFYELNSCQWAEFCSSQNQYFIIVIGIFNIFNCLAFKIIHIYFARSYSIMGDNNILQLQSSIGLNIIQELLVFITVVFKNFDENNIVGPIFICLKQLLSMAHQLDKINCHVYVLFKVFSICTVISVYFAFETCSYLLVTSFLVFFVKILLTRIKYNHILYIHQESLIKIQIIENAISNQNIPENQMVLLMIFNQHFCPICQTPQQMSRCIFKKLAKRSVDLQRQILYCQYISEKFPLKALIKLLSITTSDIYFNGAKQNLVDLLATQGQLIFKECYNQNGSQKQDEHKKKLNLKLVLEVFGISDIYFPMFIDIIEKQQIYGTIQQRDIQIFNHYSFMQIFQRKKWLIQMIKTKFDIGSLKLRNFESKETISIRVLQIFFSVIYNNQYISNIIEKEIEEILKNERIGEIEPLSCTSFIQNKIFIFQSSLLKNRGQFINLDTKKLATFFNEKEDQINLIYHCSQVMPNFIAEIHDTLINRYIQKGFTILQAQYQQTYLQNISGYLEQCVLNLMSYHDVKNNDLIMNALVSKVQGQETLLFGTDGIILGCTQQFFEKAIKSNSQYLSSHIKDIGSIQIFNIQSFLQKTPLIQFFIPNITQQIDELQVQYQRVKQYSLTNLKSIWSIQSDYTNLCLHGNEIIKVFNAFKYSQNNQQNRNQATSVSQYILNKQSYDSQKSQQLTSQQFENINIDGIPILILHPSFQNQIQKYLNSSNFCISNNNLEISYDITFNSFANSNNQLGYFILNIKEFKVLQFQSSQMVVINRSTLNAQNQIQSLKDQNQKQIQIQNDNQFNSQEIQKDVHAENNCNINVQQYFGGNEIIKSQSNLSLDQKQNLISQVKSFETNIGQILPSFQFENSCAISEQLLTSLRQENQEKKQLNVQKNNPSHIQEKILANRAQKEDENNDFASNPSKSSVSPSQREIQLLVEQICSKQQLITPLKKILLILTLSFTLIIVGIIINYNNLIKVLDQQTNGVLELIQPQNITYFYCSVFYQLWAIELDTEGICAFKNIESIKQMYDYARIYMKKLNINVPLLSHSQGIYDYEVLFFVNGELNKIIQPLETFYAIIYEKSEIAYRENLNSSNPCYQDLHTNGLLRQNIIQLSQHINDLIENINSQTISDQYSAQPIFQAYLICEVSIVVAIFAIQLKYWLLFDKIQKRILLLISTLNEMQAYEQIYKLQQVKQILNENYKSNWKIINFSEIMTGNISKKTIIYTMNGYGKRGYSSESSLSTRIQKTTLKTKINYIFMITISISYMLYLIISYIIFTSQFNNFQPSLIATLKYGQFRAQMDIASFAGGFLKTEGLLPKNNLSQINQTQVIELFKSSKDSLLSLAQEVSQAILQNSDRNNQVSRFDDFLHGNICDLRPWENLKACDLMKQNLAYSSKDNIKYLLQQGILGYTAGFVKYLNSNFDFEIENNHYNTNELNSQEVLTQSFENFFLSYFLRNVRYIS